MNGGSIIEGEMGVAVSRPSDGANVIPSQVDMVRFCLNRNGKRLSTDWVIQDTRQGVQVGTQTPFGDFKAILSPTERTVFKLRLPPAAHRKAHSEHKFLFDSDRVTTPSDGIAIAMCVLFPADFLAPIKRLSGSRVRHNVTTIEVASTSEAIEINFVFAYNLPEALRTSLSGFGECMAFMAVRGGQFLYVCRAIRPFPFRRGDGNLDRKNLSLSPTGLPGLSFMASEHPGAPKLMYAPEG